MLAPLSNYDQENCLINVGTEGKKIPRERQGDLDKSTLLCQRNGQAITLRERAEFYLENSSKSPFRAQKTHDVKQRPMRQLKAAFGETKFVELTAGEMEM